ncbi:hypothetical protein [Psychromonas ossibalaenae]|uniref:hypothetical protein n=1 Tax=Psychromonas ossibalaenae TaxID=444922 RepID=UPI0003772D0F|nr:hypothetical protein [Psychromonas ossibalaenae]
MNRLLIFILLFNIPLAAATVNEQDLKILGRALANYQLCSDISVELDDKAMFNYYSEMYKYSLLQVSTYSHNDAEIVSEEQQRSMLKLAKIDRKSLGGLCLSRFDLLSRKMQENKLAAKQSR